MNILMKSGVVVEIVEINGARFINLDQLIKHFENSAKLLHRNDNTTLDSVATATAKKALEAVADSLKGIP